MTERTSEAIALQAYLDGRAAQSARMAACSGGGGTSAQAKAFTAQVKALTANAEKAFALLREAHRELAEIKVACAELIENLEAEIMDRYTGVLCYPDQKRRWERDMAVIWKAIPLIEPDLRGLDDDGDEEN